MRAPISEVDFGLVRRRVRRAADPAKGTAFANGTAFLLKLDPSPAHAAHILLSNVANAVDAAIPADAPLSIDDPLVEAAVRVIGHPTSPRWPPREGETGTNHGAAIHELAQREPRAWDAGAVDVLLERALRQKWPDEEIDTGVPPWHAGWGGGSATAQAFFVLQTLLEYDRL